MTQERTLAVPQEHQEITAIDLPDEKELNRKLLAIGHFQTLVRNNLKSGVDYGVIPGTQKPTLLKPGAEKIAKLLNLADTYDVIEHTEDWKEGFFSYTVRAILSDITYGKLISSGLGNCNSMETKYRWRESKRKCPSCHAEAIIKGKKEFGGGWLCFKRQGGCGAKWADGSTEIETQTTGRIKNEDIYDQVNTILKMAKKRALVDAALSVGRLSEIFTQDIEELPEQEPETRNSTSDEPETPQKPTQAPQEAPLKTLVDLYNWGVKEFKLNKKQLMQTLGVSDDTQIVDLEDARAKVRAAMEAKKGATA